ncbi:MAG: ParB/RepB/Spo0J family partition protein, partial [Bacteroidota bacterium]
RTADDQQMLEMALVENIQREQLNPIEIALSYQRLLTECKLKQETLGDKVGKDRTTVNNYLRLLKLPPDVQIALRDHKISMGHARALINVEAVSTQLSLLQEIIEQALSVRNVEARVRMLTQEKPTNDEPKQKTPPTDPALQKLGNQLATRLGTKVKIQASPQHKGEIKIAFASAQELDRIFKLLQKGQ